MKTKPLATAGKLLLTENQVWPGMTVMPYLEEGAKQVINDDGEPLIVTCLIEGTPSKKQFYINGNARRIWYDGAIANAIGGFLSTVRFCPTQTFSPTDTPPNTRFAVFVAGKALKYADYKTNSVIVRTNAQNHILSDCKYAPDWWQCKCTLPETAILVPLGEIGSYQR